MAKEAAQNCNSTDDFVANIYELVLAHEQEKQQIAEEMLAWKVLPPSHTFAQIGFHVQYGMVLYGVVWCGMVWCGVVWYGMVWYGVVWCGMVWYGMVWYGMVWYGMVWCGMVWCGMV